MKTKVTLPIYGFTTKVSSKSKAQMCTFKTRKKEYEKKMQEAGEVSCTGKNKNKIKILRETKINMWAM